MKFSFPHVQKELDCPKGQREKEIGWYELPGKAQDLGQMHKYWHYNI